MSRIAFVVAVCLAVALAVSPASAGLFSWSAMTGDADSGISSSNTYTAAVNLGGSDVTVNGVTFTGAATDAAGERVLSGTGWTLTAGGTDTVNDNLWKVTGKGAGNVTGNVGGLLGDFYTNGVHQVADVLTVSGLTLGQTYVLTTYDKGWTAAGSRTQDIVASDGGSTVFDEDYRGKDNGSMLHYTYTATSDTMSLSFTPQVANGGEWNSFQFNAFSNQVATPEPGTLVLLGTGLIGLLAYAWRKRK
jgi:hypothetical protein